MTMTDEGRWPRRKRGPASKDILAQRIFEARQEKLCQAERAEPLSDFDLAAIRERLTRKK